MKTEQNFCYCTMTPTDKCCWYFSGLCECVWCEDINIIDISCDNCGGFGVQPIPACEIKD